MGTSGTRAKIKYGRENYDQFVLRFRKDGLYDKESGKYFGTKEQWLKYAKEAGYKDLSEFIRNAMQEIAAVEFEPEKED